MRTYATIKGVRTEVEVDFEVIEKTHMYSGDVIIATVTDMDGKDVMDKIENYEEIKEEIREYAI
jgi:hypothetical protein